MNNIVLDKTYTVEIPIPASSTAQQIFFPIIQVLDGKYTQGISTYSILTLLKTPSGAALANDPLVKSTYLTLVMGDVNQIWNIPLVDLITVNINTVAVPHNPYAIEMNNLKIIWAKSYVFIADITKIAGSAESFFFNIKYADDTSSSLKS